MLVRIALLGLWLQRVLREIAQPPLHLVLRSTVVGHGRRTHLPAAHGAMVLEREPLKDALAVELVFALQLDGCVVALSMLAVDVQTHVFEAHHALRRLVWCNCGDYRRHGRQIRRRRRLLHGALVLQLGQVRGRRGLLDATLVVVHVHLQQGALICVGLHAEELEQVLRQIPARMEALHGAAGEQHGAQQVDQHVLELELAVLDRVRPRGQDAETLLGEGRLDEVAQGLARALALVVVARPLLLDLVAKRQELRVPVGRAPRVHGRHARGGEVVDGVALVGLGRRHLHAQRQLAASALPEHLERVGLAVRAVHLVGAIIAPVQQGSRGGRSSPALLRRFIGIKAAASGSAKASIGQHTATTQHQWGRPLPMWARNFHDCAYLYEDGLVGDTVGKLYSQQYSIHGRAVNDTRTDQCVSLGAVCTAACTVDLINAAIDSAVGGYGAWCPTGSVYTYEQACSPLLGDEKRLSRPSVTDSMKSSNSVGLHTPKLLLFRAAMAILKVIAAAAAVAGGQLRGGPAAWEQRWARFDWQAAGGVLGGGNWLDLLVCSAGPTSVLINVQPRVYAHIVIWRIIRAAAAAAAADDDGNPVAMASEEHTWVAYDSGARDDRLRARFTAIPIAAQFLPASMAHDATGMSRRGKSAEASLGSSPPRADTRRGR
ncbi:hypothetical protein ON010_g7161 [Phytophthora cinnamomi]|nr:hypothetical protein ON010_g7161 [Phytophthora cinnamomi]